MVWGGSFHSGRLLCGATDAAASARHNCDALRRHEHVNARCRRGVSLVTKTHTNTRTERERESGSPGFVSLCRVMPVPVGIIQSFLERMIKALRPTHTFRS